MSTKARAVVALIFMVILLGVGVSASFASEGMLITLGGQVIYGFWPVFWYGLLVLYPLVLLIVAAIFGAVIGLMEWVLRGDRR